MTTPDDTTFESEVRAMLSRRADDITFDPTNDVPLTVTPTPVTLGRVLRRTRMAMLAAACLLIVTCLGAVIATAGEDDGQTVQADQSQTAALDEVEPTAREISPDPTGTTEVTSTTQAPATPEVTSTTQAPATPEVTSTTEVPAPPSEGTPAAAAPTEPPPPAPTASITPPGPAPAHPRSTITFNQTEVSDPYRWSTRECSGTLRPTLINGILRIDRSGPTDRAVTIGLKVSGSLAQHVDMKRSVTIPAGQRAQSITMDVGGTVAGSATITAQAGTGYVLGSPAKHTFTIGAAPVETDCLRPVSATPATQTITVGQAPADVVFSPRRAERTHPVLDGALPPGLRLDVRSAGGGKDAVRWSGAATTPGTYQVTVRHCDKDTLAFYSACDGTSVLTITVREP